jgi:ribosomal protein L37AE/L43A
MAKTSYAIKRLSKYAEVEVAEGSGLHTCVFNEVVIQFYDQGGRAICIRVRRVDDHDDPYTDYCAGSFYDNISQAINRALAEWTLCHREPCPACGHDIGTKRWVDGKTVWTCHKCGGPISGKYQKPVPTPAAKLGTQENQPGLLPIGSKIYYTGDMANQDGEGWVGSHMPASRFGSASLNIQLEDGRVFGGVYPSNVRWPHEDNRGQRFVIREVAKLPVNLAENLAEEPAPKSAQGSGEVEACPAARPRPQLRLLSLN